MVHVHQLKKAKFYADWLDLEFEGYESPAGPRSGAGGFEAPLFDWNQSMNICTAMGGGWDNATSTFWTPYDDNDPSEPDREVFQPHEFKYSATSANAPLKLWCIGGGGWVWTHGLTDDDRAAGLGEGNGDY